MFGKKSDDDKKGEKACPFTFPFTRKLAETGVNKFGYCIKAECQMWDSQRNDCGLKQKYNNDD